MKKMKRSEKLEFAVASALNSVADMVELGFCKDSEIQGMTFDVAYAYMSHMVTVHPTKDGFEEKLCREIGAEIQKQIDNDSWEDIYYEWMMNKEYEKEQCPAVIGAGGEC